ncbi:MAG: YacL family protein [Motiliproteus sp.]
MDYEFSTDPIGNHVARCSMGHEALGSWLTAEIGTNHRQISTLFEAVQRLQQRQAWEFQLEGTEYALELTRDEAIVRAHSLFADADELTDAQDYYDAESLAQCGLEDFAELLHAWRQFIGIELST